MTLELVWARAWLACRCVCPINAKGEGTQPLSPRVVEDGEEAGEVEVEGKIEVALRLEL